MADESQTPEQKALAEELIEKFTQLITSGFGLVAALAWNDAIQAVFARFFNEGEGLLAKVSYAVIVTLITISIVYQLSQISNRIKNGINKRKKIK